MSPSSRYGLVPPSQHVPGHTPGDGPSASDLAMAAGWFAAWSLICLQMSLLMRVTAAPVSRRNGAGSPPTYFSDIQKNGWGNGVHTCKGVTNTKGLQILASSLPSCVWLHMPRAASFPEVAGSGDSPTSGGQVYCTGSISLETVTTPLVAPSPNPHYRLCGPRAACRVPAMKHTHSPVSPALP